MSADLFRRAALCALFLGLWAVFLARLSPSVGVGDSGEFITAAATLSLPHAPSYPLFSLAGKAFHAMVPFGNSAYRLNLMSAFFTLLSAVLIFRMGRRMGLARAPSAMAAVFAAGAPAFFHNGLVTEVFALNTFLALLMWDAALRPGPRGAVLAAFVLGLGMGNHQTVLFAAPGAAVLLWRTWKRKEIGWSEAKRSVPVILLGLLWGLSVYLALPARSLKNPPLNWGRPQDLSGVLRTFLRKDYGTLALALGEQPPRSPATYARQLSRYAAAGLRDQFSWPGVAVVVLGFWIAWRRDRALATALATAWFVSGPFFLCLGNLPFDAQSHGVLERFYILPAAFAALGAGFLFDALGRRGKFLSGALLILPGFLLVRSVRAFPLRGDFLAQDYARSIFRSLPPGASFFMDGGDDTFFTTAFQRFVQRQRADLRLFDRGGLIFTSAYGLDFRGLRREDKEPRRQSVERSLAAVGPLFYSTMNEAILPGVPLGQQGFLYRAGAGPVPFLWDLYALRSLYPPASPDYRTRALAPFFPFLRARALWRAGAFGAALAFYDRAWALGPDVPWLKNNFAAQMAECAYERLQAGDWKAAESLSRRGLQADPANVTALSHLGVAAERQGDLDAAAGWYARALTLDPNRVEVLFNWAVIRWRQERWDEVVSALERVLQLQPEHAQALRYLPAARQKRERHG